MEGSAEVLTDKVSERQINTLISLDRDQRCD